MAMSALAVADTKKASPQRRASWVAFALLLPGLAYLALFFLVPFVSLLITSFGVNDTSQYGAFYYAFNWQNYVDVIAEYWPQFLRSFWYALLATLFALLISYPIAYFIGVVLRDRPLIRNLLLVLVIAPFFISFLLRTFAWKQILADVLDTPLSPVVGHPGASLGAAVIAAVGTGLLDGWDSTATFQTLGEPVVPNPRNVDRYAEAYTQWRELGDVLTPISHRIARKARP